MRLRSVRAFRTRKDKLARFKKTDVLVTHDMAEAAFFGDVIVMMRTGRVVQQGTLDDLLANPAEPFVGEFIRAQRGIAV